MTYGFVMDVPAPIEFYDALHAEIRRRSTGGVDGLLLHVGRQTPQGFQITEVWESKELCDRFNAEVVWPARSHTCRAGRPHRSSRPRRSSNRGA